MIDSEFRIWAAMKILELRKALNYNNSFFTTSELKLLYDIEDQYVTKFRKEQKGKIVNLESYRRN